MPTTFSTPTAPKLVLRLFHGRRAPGDILEDWGFDGPRILGVQSLHITYLTTFAVAFVDISACEAAAALTGWPLRDENMLEMRIVDDLIVTTVDGKAAYYGDWSLSLVSDT